MSELVPSVAAAVVWFVQFENVGPPTAITAFEALESETHCDFVEVENTELSAAFEQA